MVVTLNYKPNVIFRKWVLLLISFIFIVVPFICYWSVDFFSEPYTYHQIEQVPENEVGLVLGTSKYLKGKMLNPYFKNRIEAATSLYKARKIKFIVVSGDNSTLSYNEPRDMQKALIEAGIPKEVIYLDYAGFRTLDSVIRCKKVFGQDRFTIISQDFHNKRAIYISRMSGIQAVAYNAKEVSNMDMSLRIKTREFFARVKAFIDVHIIKEQPKFLGDKIAIG
jgi:SanA protein